MRDDETLKRLVDAMTRENGGSSSAGLATVLGASPATITRIRHDLDFSYKQLRHGPVMKRRQIEARLDFCLAHVNDNWTATMFTDESRFATSPDSPVMWWVKKDDKIYLEKEKFPASFLVWGGIIGDEKTTLLKCPNRMKSQGSIDLLDTNGIVAFLHQRDENAVFQQDGATCHTALRTRRWFESQNVTLLGGWPSNSPDLSPIEQVWGITKHFIIRRFGSTTPLTLDQLEEAVFEAYNAIEPKTIAILTMSVRFRVQLCIERNGKFVGDAIGECCHRAKVQYESLTDIRAIAFDAPQLQGENEARPGEMTIELPPLPSFRTANKSRSPKTKK